MHGISIIQATPVNAWVPAFRRAGAACEKRSASKRAEKGEGIHDQDSFKRVRRADRLAQSNGIHNGNEPVKYGLSVVIGKELMSSKTPAAISKERRRAA